MSDLSASHYLKLKDKMRHKFRNILFFLNCKEVFQTVIYIFTSTVSLQTKKLCFTLEFKVQLQFID